MTDSAKDYKCSPCKEYRFFLYDPGAMSDTRNQAIANFVQQLKNDGTWDLIGSTMIPGPNGPLNKADMGAIWAKQCRTVDTGLVYSTGPAVDLVKADEAMRKFSREPWDLPPPTNTTHPIPTEPPTDD